MIQQQVVPSTAMVDAAFCDCVML